MIREEGMLKKYRIGVLAGGSSSERDISLKSGKAVFKALTENGFKAEFIDVDEKSFSSLVGRLDIDIAFIALHGKFGEDGTIQRMLARRNIPYTGSGPESSALALDKLASKRKFASSGINMPDYRVVHSKEEAEEADIFLPCAVKPRCEGSSVGLSIASSISSLEKAIEEALKFGDDVIIEKFISGREITVGVLDEEALPPVEIKALNGVYDFNAKYQSGETLYIVPAELEEGQYKRAQKVALGAHKALGCEGFSRIDLRLSDEGEFFVLEVNTIPGLTERSLLPMAAKAAGLDFPELCLRMLYNALRNERREEKWQKEELLKRRA